MKYENHLILGGCGFIGTNLALFLKEKGAKVRILDDFSNSPSLNISLLQSEDIEIINEDVFDVPSVLESFKGQNIVYNLVGCSVVDDGFNSAEPLMQASLLSSQIAVQAATQHPSVQKIILFSNLHAYGHPSKYRNTLVETDNLNPINPYGATGKCVETVGKMFCEAYQRPVAIIRLGEVHGKYMNVFSPHHSFSSMVMSIVNNYAPMIPSDGEHSLDYIFVEDVCKYLLQIANEQSENLYDVYNLCSGKGIKVNELVSIFMRHFGKESLEDKIVYDKMLRPYVFHLTGNNNKLKDSFGDLFTNPEEAFKETLDWMKDFILLNRPPED